jgi:hypothetical protein
MSLLLVETLAGKIDLLFFSPADVLHDSIKLEKVNRILFLS